MKRLKDNFVYEFRVLNCARNMFIALLLFAAAMYFTQDGSWQYKSILKNKDDFVKIEKKTVEMHNSMERYGGHGFRVLFIPSPLNVFFYNSGVSNDLTADLDVGPRLTISSSFKGRDAFKDRAGNFADFSGLFIFIGTVLVLLYGWDAFRKTDYLKFLSSAASFKQVFWYTIAARFLLVVIYFFIVTAAAVLVAAVNGIALTAGDLLYLGIFFLVWILFSFLFLIIGAIIGLKVPKNWGLAAVIIAWLVLVYVIPLGIQKITSTSARDIKPNSQLDLEKFDFIMQFEKRAIEEGGKFKIENAKTKTVRDLIESFMNNEYKGMKGIEDDLEDSSTKKVNNHRLYSLFTPATFLANLREEMGSTGYENVILFSRYVKDLKDKFCMFYKEKKFYSDDKTVESFIKGDENIYYAKSWLPDITAGIIVLIIYIIFLLPISLLFLKQSLFKITDEEMEEIKTANLFFKKGKFSVGQIYSSAIPKLLFILLSGKHKRIKEKGFNGKVMVDDVNIGAESRSEYFLCLCKPEDLPDNLKVKDFICFIAGIAGTYAEEKIDILSSALLKGIAGKKIKQLDRYEKSDVLLEITGIIKRDIYVINDIAPNMLAEFAYRFKDKMEALSEQGAVVIYLTTDDAIRKNPKRDSPLYINPYWSGEVESYKKQDESIKMKQKQK